MQYSQRSGMPPVVLNLIILNFICFLVVNVLHMPGLPFLGLRYPIPGGTFQPYQLLTYMFMHGGWMHIIFNMFGLWMFGTQIEHTWGSKKFLIYYLICGIGAGAANLGYNYYQVHQLTEAFASHAISAADYNQTIDYLIHSPYAETVGASGAIYGILVAFAMLFPNQIIMMLFPPIPMKAKYFVMVFAAIELFSGINPSAGDYVAHFAHLGGALIGFLILLYWKARGELYKWF